MVNWFRTLLLNQRSVVPGPGEEYVPPDYSPVTTTPAVEVARSALLGSDADRTGANITIAKIIKYLSTTAFAADPVAYDSRITYDPTDPLDIWNSIGPTVSTVAGPSAVGWEGSQTFLAAGQAYETWRASTTSGGAYEVVAGNGASASGTATPVTLGVAVPLIGSNLNIVVPAAADGAWAVSLLVPPAHDWVSAATISAVGLFDASSSARERAWFAVWSDTGFPAPLRACALALAVATRTYERVLAREA